MTEERTVIIRRADHTLSVEIYPEGPHAFSVRVVMFNCSHTDYRSIMDIKEQSIECDGADNEAWTTVFDAWKQAVEIRLNTIPVRGDDRSWWPDAETLMPTDLFRTHDGRRLFNDVLKLKTCNTISEYRDAILNRWRITR